MPRRTGTTNRTNRITVTSNPETPKRRIKIRAIEVKPNALYMCYILLQTHRSNDFSPTGGETFTASNGVKLVSASNPNAEITNEHKLKAVYVRGSNRACDNDFFALTQDNLDDTIKAIQEYNKAGDSEYVPKEKFKLVPRKYTYAFIE